MPLAAASSIPLAKMVGRRMENEDAGRSTASMTAASVRCPLVKTICAGGETERSSFVPGQRANRDKQLNRWHCKSMIRAIFEGREIKVEWCCLHENCVEILETGLLRGLNRSCLNLWRK
jgi:hypothetical protein